MRPKGGLADSANILMLIVGLTGGMGVGKSTVAGLLSDLGAEVVDVVPSAVKYLNLVAWLSHQ